MKRLLLALCVTLVLPMAAHAQGSHLDSVLTKGVLRVGMPGDYRPFGLKDAATGAFAGLDVDMAERLAASLGAKVEIVPTKWADLIADIGADKFDIGMGGISITLARQRAVFFSTPVLRTGKSAIARCTDKAKFDSLTAIDRAGVKVLSNPGGTNEKFDRATLKSAEIVVLADNNAVWPALIAGQGDVMITDNVETRLQQKLHPELCAIRPEAPFDFGELGYMLPRDMAWKLYVDQFLHVSAETGEMKALLAKWLE